MASSSSNPYSFQSFASFLNANFGVLLIAGVFFVVGFFVGSLWTENKMLRGGSKVAAPSASPTAAAPAADAGPTAEQLKNVPPVTDDDYIRGNKNAKVVLVEYSDFECPFCASFHPTMEKIIEEYGDKIAWVYRHYPLSFHPQAMPSAQASECVAKEAGKDAFWKFADTIFATNAKNGGITKDDVLAAAEAAGANRASVQTCIDGGEFKTKVQDMMDKASTAGIGGTPGTILISGDQYELINGALPYESVKTTIDKYLN